jgi:hypothetical protein
MQIKLHLAALFYFLTAASYSLAQHTFTRHYGSAEFDRGMYVSHTSDSGYIATGYSGMPGNYDLYVLKTDGDGNEQWHKTYGGNKLEVGWSIHELNDKGFLLHGSTASKDTTKRDDIYLLRLDARGNVMWEKTFGNQLYERTTHLLFTTDNHYLLIGQRNINADNIDSYIIKIDTAGNLLWEKTYGGPLMERTFYGAETPAGEFLISGSVLPYKNNKADILLIKISKNGDLLWTKTYGEENVHDIIHSFGLNRDRKTFTAIGYIESGKPGFHDALFMQFDGEGKLLRKQTHHSGEDLRVMHAEETNDGGFIATGFTRKDIDNELYDAVLIKLDRSGHTEWLKTFGTPGKDDQGYWIITNADGGFTITGYTHSHGMNGDLWLIKTNANGVVAEN